MAGRMRYKRARKTSRRSYRRRRMFKKYTRKFTKADGYHTEKINYTQNLVVTGGQANFYAFWNRPLDLFGAFGKFQCVTGTNNTNLQFSQCYGMYREYRIKGMKLSFHPVTWNLDNTSVTDIRVGTRMATISTGVPSISQVNGSLDYKQYKSSHSWKRYYHVYRWARTVADYGSCWGKCSEAVTNVPITTTDCVTLVTCQQTDFPENAILGQIEITYYVQFRSRQVASGGPEMIAASERLVTALNAADQE